MSGYDGIAVGGIARRGGCSGETILEHCGGARAGAVRRAELGTRDDGGVSKTKWEWALFV